jgi:hypothetical protein
MDLIKPLVFILLIFALAFMLIPRQLICAETFATKDPKIMVPRGTERSTTAIFRSTKNNKEFQREIKASRDVIDDRDDVLHAQSCYQLPADGINRFSIALTKSGVLFSEIKTLTFSGDEIKSKIVQNVLDTQKRIPGVIIRGPVYAFISQAPFYRDVTGREMSMQFTVNDYLLKPYNIMKATTPGEAPPPIYVTVYIVYAGYSINRRPTPKPLNIDKLSFQGVNGRSVSIENLASRDRMCRVECPKTSTTYPMFCGCATGAHPYSSTCLGPSNQVNKNADKVVKSTFMFRYLVNPKEPTFLKNKTFAG